MEGKRDGNAAGGLLQEIFPFAMTRALTTCAGGGATNTIGALAVYTHPLGTIIHCPSCALVHMRIAHVQGRYLLDLRGVRVLQITA